MCNINILFYVFIFLFCTFIFDFLRGQFSSHLLFDFFFTFLIKIVAYFLHSAYIFYFTVLFQNSSFVMPVFGYTNFLIVFSPNSISRQPSVSQWIILTANHWTLYANVHLSFFHIVSLTFPHTLYLSAVSPSFKSTFITKILHLFFSTCYYSCYFSYKNNNNYLSMSIFVFVLSFISYRPCFKTQSFSCLLPSNFLLFGLSNYLSSLLIPSLLWILPLFLYWAYYFP